uniref:Mediator of RNA polymerase II transcription subunit 7 n=1 Tax=Bursaphelenchus xylophilus TaxID=6326 RepID=A0A1I7SMX5_BURXY
MDPSWPKYQLPKANRDLLFQFYCNNLEKTVKYFKAEMEDLQVIAEIRAFEMMPLNPMTEKMSKYLQTCLSSSQSKQ